MSGIDWNAALLQSLGQLQRQQTNVTSAGAVNNYNPNPPSNIQWNAPTQQQQQQENMQQLLIFMLQQQAAASQQQAIAASPPSAAPSRPAPPWGPNPLASVLVHPEGCAMLWQLFQVWIQAQHSQQQQQQGSSYTLPGVPTLQTASTNPFGSSSSRTIDWNALFPMFFQACLTSLQTPMALPPMGQIFSPPAAAAFEPATLTNNGLATLQATGNPPFAMSGEHQDDSEDHEDDNDDDNDRKMPAIERRGPHKKRQYNHESFPEKLHRLITDAAANGQEDVVRFTNEGTRFQIVDTKKFEELLPRYFRHGKISSFKRVLHMYDFKRIVGTWNEGIFEHPHFRRDEPEMLKKMLRVGKRFGDKY